MLIYCPVGASWEGAEPGKSADGNWLFVYTCVTGNAGMKAKSYALKSIAPVIPNEEKAVKKALTNNFLSFFFFASSGSYNNWSGIISTIHEKL